MDTKNTENKNAVEELDIEQLMKFAGGKDSGVLVCPKCGATVANEQALALHLVKKHKGK